MSELVIKGQAWICNDQLIQDQVVFSDSENASDNGASRTVVLIDNIWDDLFSGAGTYKWNGKNYFYWEYEMTDTTSDTGDVITVKYECPVLTYEKAKEMLVSGETPEARDEKEKELVSKYNGIPFPDPRKASLGKGDYVDYYITKFWVALENSYKNGNIQRTEVTFPGSSHVGLDGDMVTVEEVTVTNHDFGDLANLLSLY
jgi:hypothetical protein